MLRGCLAVQEPPSSPERPGSLVMLPGSTAAGSDSSSPCRALSARSRQPSGGDGGVGLAVVGPGYWTPNLLRALAENPDAEVRWMCDLGRDRLVKHHPRYPAARVTTRFERVLADPGVEAVLIAAPVDTHYELAARALQAGRHVFVEKPLASSSELAEHLVRMARDRRRILLCGHACASETFGEYHLSYRSGDILSPRIETYQPLAVQLGQFTRAIRAGAEVGYHTAPARSVVRIVEAADQSPLQKGREVTLDHGESGERSTPRRGLALA